MNRVEPIPIEEAEANVDGNLKLVDDDKCDDQRTRKSSLGHRAHAKACKLEIPPVIRHEIGVGEPGNLTDDRDERDRMDEQSEDRDRDRKTSGRRSFRQARRPPARLRRNIGEPGHDIFDGENR